MYFGRETTLIAIDGSKETTIQYPIKDRSKLRVIVDDFTTGKTKITNYDSFKDYVKQEKEQERQRRVVNTDNFGSNLLAIDRVGGQITSVDYYNSNLDFLLNRSPLVGFDPRTGTITVRGSFTETRTGNIIRLTSGNNILVFIPGANQVFFSADGGATVFSYVGGSTAQTQVSGFPAVQTTRSPSIASAAPSTDRPNSDAPTTGRPITEEPTTGQPDSDAPTTGQPDSDAPTTARPNSAAPSSPRPTTARPPIGGSSNVPSSLPVGESTSAPIPQGQGTTRTPNAGTNSPFFSTPPSIGTFSPSAPGIATRAPVPGSSSNSQGGSDSTGLIVGVLAGLGVVAAGITWLYRRNQPENHQEVQLNDRQDIDGVIGGVYNNPMFDNDPRYAQAQGQQQVGLDVLAEQADAIQDARNADETVNYEEPTDDGRGPQNNYVDPDTILQTRTAPRATSGTESHYASALPANALQTVYQGTTQSANEDNYAVVGTESPAETGTAQPGPQIVYNQFGDVAAGSTESATDDPARPDPAATYSAVAPKKPTLADIQAAKATKAGGPDGVVYAAPYHGPASGPVRDADEGIIYADIPDTQGPAPTPPVESDYASLEDFPQRVPQKKPPTDEHTIYTLPTVAGTPPTVIPTHEGAAADPLARKGNGHTPT